MPVIPVMFMEPGVGRPYVHWRDVAGVAVKLAKCFFKVLSFEMFHDMLSCADDSVSIYQLGEGDHKVGNHGKAERREGATLPCYGIYWPSAFSKDLQLATIVQILLGEINGKI